MSRVPSLVACSFALTLLLLGAAAGLPESPPEPDGYRMDDYRAPTPATLRGAAVLNTREAAALWEEGSSVFVDVLPRPTRPANLPPRTVWRDAPHDSLPGAVWIPNTGYGTLSADSETYFRESLDRVSNGNMQKPLVFFCQRHCWMSWNAAKRALLYGYRRVFWFPDGTDGWFEAGLPRQQLEPQRHERR